MYMFLSTTPYLLPCDPPGRVRPDDAALRDGAHARPQRALPAAAGAGLQHRLPRRAVPHAQRRRRPGGYPGERGGRRQVRRQPRRHGSVSHHRHMSLFHYLELEQLKYKEHSIRAFLTF